MIIIQTLIIESAARPTGNRGSVALEVVLSKPLHTMPYLVIYKESFYPDTPDPATSYTIHPFASTGNTFLFELPNQDEPKYFSLVRKEGDGIGYLMKNYHFEPGDNIVVNIDNSNAHIACCPVFSGAGAAKYRCLTEIRNRILFDEVRLLPQFNVIYLYNIDNRNIRNIHLALTVLKKFKPELSDYSYELLKVDIMAKEWSVLISNFKHKMAAALQNDDTYAYLRVCYEYESKLKLDLEMPVSGTVQYSSLAYAHFKVEKIVFVYLKKYIKINFVKIYYQIYLEKDCILRDKMIVILLMRYKTEMKGNYSSLIKHAITHLKDKKCLDKLMSMLLL